MNIPVKNINYRNLGLLLLVAGFIGGLTVDSNAQQRDPFAKPVVRVIKQKVTVGVTQKQKPAGPTVIAPPSIQARIDGYRANRQKCAESGITCPKPTSVLTLDEMQVTGIFRTPRGYAAMVEASPLNPKLSYTIYPGERFYDGQLVAIEDTRLIFRRVIRMTDGKEVVASADKILRQDTVNDLAASRSEPQVNAAAPTAAADAAVTTGTAGSSSTTPQMSAEAVPLSPQKDGAAATAAIATQANPNGAVQNKTESTETPAAQTAAPAVTAASESDAVPVKAKPKAKAKGKPKAN